MSDSTETIPQTEEAWTQEMEKTDASPLGTAKKVFVLLKTAFILYQTVKAAIAWRRSKKPMGVPAQMCLLFSGVIVALVTVFKFTSKQIGPLVTLQAMSHYLCFIVLHVLVGFVQCRKFELRDKILKAFSAFHLIWWALILFSWKGASCSEKNFYPDAFILNNCFSFGVYVMVYMLHSRGYLLDWSKDE